MSTHEDKPDNLRLWRNLSNTDKNFTKSFDRGNFKGTAVDALYNVKRVTELLGPVGFAWGWRVKSERLDVFGTGEDQQTIHTCVIEVWFRQPDGTKEYVEHVGHTKATYWTRPRRPGDKPRLVIDEEFAKKSVTDALSKVMVNLGASADIWLGRFDGNKYVADEPEPPPVPPPAKVTPIASAAPPPPPPDPADPLRLKTVGDDRALALLRSQVRGLLQEGELDRAAALVLTYKPRFDALGGNFASVLATMDEHVAKAMEARRGAGRINGNVTPAQALRAG